MLVRNSLAGALAPPTVPSLAPDAPTDSSDQVRRERLIRALSAVTFLIFFQAYMVAPLLPRLATVFGASSEDVGLIIPAYLVPYGFATLVYGLLGDRFGERRLIFVSLGAFTVLTALTATAHSVAELTAWRLATGLGASAVVPLALVLIGKLFPYESRGRPLGWLFGAMAGGMATGSTLGAVLEPFIGWRGVFLLVSAGGAGAFLLLFPYRDFLGSGGPRSSPAPIRSHPVLDSFAGYAHLLGTARALRTYGYVFLNALFHSGVFTWLGLYFQRRYGLGEVGIGIALLGYGVPGFILGPIIGRVADRAGRGRLIPGGLAIAALAAGALILHLPLIVAGVTVTVLSLGYDMTQPLFAGIVTTLGRGRPGQAMGLNVFALFSGFGLGSLLFGTTLRLGFATALAIFAVIQLAAAFAAVPLFRSEVPPGERL